MSDASDAQPPPIPPASAFQYPEQSNALLVLILSVLSFVTCSGLISPVVWVMAQRELDAIDQGRRDPTKRDLARAAKILGIVGTVFIGAVILFVVIVIAISIAANA